MKFLMARRKEDGISSRREAVNLNKRALIFCIKGHNIKGMELT